MLHQMSETDLNATNWFCFLGLILRGLPLVTEMCNPAQMTSKRNNTLLLFLERIFFRDIFPFFLILVGGKMWHKMYLTLSLVQVLIKQIDKMMLMAHSLPMAWILAVLALIMYSCTREREVENDSKCM